MKYLFFSVALLLSLFFSASVDAQTWDFEDDNAGWTAKNAELSVIDSLSFSSFHAIATKANAVATESIIQKNDALNALSPEQKIFYRFFISEQSKQQIDSVVTFVAYGTDSSMVSYSHPAKNIRANSWNKISAQIPTDVTGDSLRSIGLKVFKKNMTDTPVFITDLISTDPNEIGTTNLTRPENFEATSTSQFDITLQWTPSEGSDSIRYHLSTFPLRPVFLSVYPTDSQYTHSELRPNTELSYILVAEDSLERRTASLSVDAQTLPFPSHATFDFERDLEAWTATNGEAVLSDSIRISGVYSVKFSPSSSESAFQLSSVYEKLFSSTIKDINRGHRLAYHVFTEQKNATDSTQYIMWYKNSGETVYSDTLKLANGGWKEISSIISPETDSVYAIGLDIVHPAEAPYPTSYIDLISTLSSPVRRPNLSVPTNLEILSDFTDSTAIKWNHSIGNTSSRVYRIYRGDENARVLDDFSLAGTTTDSIFVDSGLEPNTTYRYVMYASTRLGEKSFPSYSQEVTTTLGTSTQERKGIPDEFELSHNYPNPFNPTTQIAYNVPTSTNVSIKVFNVTGQLVQTLVNESKNPGRYTVTFDAGSLASGIYFYRIDASTYSKVRRMMLIK